MSIGSRVRELRDELGYTKRELAGRSGLSSNAIYLIEVGRRSPNAETLIRLAAALGVEVGDFFPKAQPLLFGEEEPEASKEEWRTVGEREAVPTLALEAVRRLLDERVGTSWLALPEEEWKGWWLVIPPEEARERRRQIVAEWEFLKPEFAALQEGKPSLLPRRMGEGGTFLTLWKRAVIEAPERVPTSGNEPDSALKRRQWEDRPLEWTEAKPPQAQGTPDDAGEAETG